MLPGLARTAAVVALMALASACANRDAGPARLDGAVVRVIDGDTIHVRTGHPVEKVRYIGVNTPDTRHPARRIEPGGREAAHVDRRLVGGGTVRHQELFRKLERDVRRASGGVARRA